MLLLYCTSLFWSFLLKLLKVSVTIYLTVYRCRNQNYRTANKIQGRKRKKESRRNHDIDHSLHKCICYCLRTICSLCKVIQADFFCKMLLRFDLLMEAICLSAPSSLKGLDMLLSSHKHSETEFHSFLFCQKFLLEKQQVFFIKDKKCHHKSKTVQNWFFFFFFLGGVRCLELL